MNNGWQNSNLGGGSFGSAGGSGGRRKSFGAVNPDGSFGNAAGSGGGRKSFGPSFGGAANSNLGAGGGSFGAGANNSGGAAFGGGRHRRSNDYNEDGNYYGGTNFDDNAASNEFDGDNADGDFGANTANTTKSNLNKSNLNLDKNGDNRANARGANSNFGGAGNGANANNGANSNLNNATTQNAHQNATAAAPFFSTFAQPNARLVLAAIILTYAFCAFLRCYWIAWAGDIDQFIFNGQLMINTNDGYFFAEGARDILAGFHQPNDLSAVEQPLSQFTALLARILPVRLETLFIYMPVFLGALVVVPLVLIGREFGSLLFGVVSGLLVALVPSFYARTNGGYYDTDIYTLFFPLLVGYALIRLYNERDFLSLALVAACALVANWFHYQTNVFIFAGGALFAVAAFMQERRNWLLYIGVLLAALASTDMPLLVKLIAIVIVLAVTKLRPQSAFSLYGVVAVGVLALAFMVIGGTFQTMLEKVLYYAVSGDEVDAKSKDFAFYDVSQTISEAQKVGFFDSLLYVFPSKLLVLCSVVGFVALCWKRREVLYFLPMCVLGLLSFKAGVRFTMYSAVSFGMGIAAVLWAFYACAGRLGVQGAGGSNSNLGEKPSLQARIAGLDGGANGAGANSNLGALPSLAFVGLLAFAVFCIYEAWATKFGFLWFSGVTEYSAFNAAAANATAANPVAATAAAKMPSELVYKLAVTVIFVIFVALFALYLVRNFARLGLFKCASLAAVFVAVASVVNINLAYVYSSRSGTVLTKDEMVVLDELGKVAQREDYCISWWDWGYPIRYYADVKTLTDGAKHFGWQNYPISFILTRTPVAAANMARLDVEFTESYFRQHQNLSREDNAKMPSNINAMLAAYNVSRQNVNGFVNGALNSPNIQLPPKSRDIYLFLPHRISDIFATIALFSWRNIGTGEDLMSQFWFFQSEMRSQPFDRSDGKWVGLDGNFAIKLDGTKFSAGESVIELNSFVTMKFDNKTRKFERGVVSGNPQSLYYGVFLQDLGRIYLMNRATFASTFVQMFMLGEYDPNLYELVAWSATAKLYKFKR